MSRLREQSPLPRLAYRVGEAAQVLGVSEDHFARHIAGELRWVRRGSAKLVARSELERWLDSAAAHVLEAD
jgi:excisionase family DNA binding protein